MSVVSELVVAIPSKELDRSWVPKEEREGFAKLTGIHHTWRWEGTTLSLAHQAASCLMEKDVRSLVVVTQSPDGSCPPTAVALAGAMGLPKDIPMFDVNQACAGFVYGLWLAANCLPNPCMLVVVDRLRMDQYQPPTSNLIFSDAAAALIVTDELDLPPTFLNEPSGCGKLHASRAGYMHMDGGAVFDFVTRNVPQFISRYEHFTGACDLLVQHQANLSMMGWVDKKTGYVGKSLRSIEQYGNASMVSIPIAIAANEQEALAKRLLLAGYGAGWSAGLAVLDWSSEPVSRIVRC